LGFELHVDHFVAMVALIVCTAVTFVFVLLLCIRLVGDVGKALAMLLLALQISASGGVVPVELSSDFFTALSPWLPMTWVVQGLKAAMFDAYEGDWFHPLLQTGGLLFVCAVLAVGVGRWHYSKSSNSRPMLDL
jgi:putative membrane protein